MDDPLFFEKLVALDLNVKAGQPLLNTTFYPPIFCYCQMKLKEANDFSSEVLYWLKYQPTMSVIIRLPKLTNQPNDRTSFMDGS